MDAEMKRERKEDRVVLRIFATCTKYSVIGEIQIEYPRWLEVVMIGRLSFMQLRNRQGDRGRTMNILTAKEPH